MLKFLKGVSKEWKWKRRICKKIFISKYKKNQQTTEMESAQGNPEHCGTTKRKQPKNES
jgi:hypothetical protein